MSLPKPRYHSHGYHALLASALMAIKKSDKILGIVVVIIVTVGLSQNACVQAGWASHRIRPGMSVQEALQVSGDWM